VRRLLLAAAALIAASLAAQRAQEPDFQETQGDFKVFGLPSWEVELPPDGPLVLVGSGSPFRAVSPSRGLELTARRLRALFDVAKRGQTTFRSGVLTGDVQVELRKESKGGADLLQAASERIELADGAEKAELDSPGPLTFRSEAKAAEGRTEVIDGRAAAAAFVLAPLTQAEPSGGRLRTAVLSGGAEVEIMRREGAAPDSAFDRIRLASSRISLSRSLREGRIQTEFELPGRFEALQSVVFAPGGRALRRSLSVKAASGTGMLSAPSGGQARIEGLDLAGPVEFDVEADGLDSQKRPIRQKILAESASARARALEGGRLQIELEGAIRFRYDRSPLGEGGPEASGYAAQADRLTLVLDEAGDIVSLKAGKGAVQTGGGR
jgi:hypothetical protein